MLAETAARHTNKINVKSYERKQDSKEENDSCCPIFDNFYTNGASSEIWSLKNFTHDKVEHISNFIEHKVDISFRAGRGTKSVVQPKECLLMALTVMRRGGVWDYLIQMLNCKGPNFEHLIFKFVSITFLVQYIRYVDLYEKNKRSN